MKREALAKIVITQTGDVVDSLLEIVKDLHRVDGMSFHEFTLPGKNGPIEATSAYLEKEDGQTYSIAYCSDGSYMMAKDDEKTGECFSFVRHTKNSRMIDDLMKFLNHEETNND